MAKRNKKRKKIVVDKTIYVTSAFELEKDIKDKIIKKFGKNEKYEFIIDKSIIGGVKIKNAGEIFDGSVKNLLSSLKLQMIKN